MIVDSMTFEEVYQEIERDEESLVEWWMKERKVLAGIAKRRPNFPMVNWIEWESPRRLHYLVWSKVYGKNYNNNALTVFLVLRRVRNGFEVFTTRMPWQVVARKMVVLPHVFERYADPERCNVRKQGLELIKHFIERNSYGEPTRNQRLAGRSVRYKGGVHVCNCCKDGVMLGQEEGDMYIAHTFITYAMATGLQVTEFETQRQKLTTDGEMMMKIKSVYGH